MDTVRGPVRQIRERTETMEAEVGENWGRR